MESNHALPAFRTDVLTTLLERSVDHSFRSVLCSKGNTSNITETLWGFPENPFFGPKIFVMDSRKNDFFSEKKT